MTQKTAIIIVNFNRCEEIRKCIDSIKTSRASGYDIICVDNGSTDNSLQMLEKDYPDVALIKNRKNLGPSTARNQGVRYALDDGYRYLLFIDSDAVIGSNTLDILISAERKLQNPGFISALIYHYARPNVIFSAGGFFDRSSFEEIHNYVIKEEFINVDFVPTTCVLTTDRVVKEIGLLREEFFVYYEDLEWVLRTAKVGYNNYVIRDAIAWHPTSYEKRAIKPAYIFYYRSRNRMLLKDCVSSTRISRMEVFKDAFKEVGNILFAGKEVLRITYAVASGLGFIHYIKKRFYKSPDYFYKTPVEYIEYRIKNKLYRTFFWCLARRIKRKLFQNKGGLAIYAIIFAIALLR